ncbi:hypothetical protein BC628DRAFT_1330305 [Trametes gibbosa]|nr:hypothetical protein BC628DRAFT_1330305 [Trametes gibbosa]
MASKFTTAASGKPTDSGNASEAKESTTIRFEWPVHGLKSLFEGSKGEAKSKVIKSPRFGDGRWQILFYANAGIVGTDGQTWVSLYLACEPTTAEKENAVNGRWSREGLFNFNFEIRNPTKTIQFNFKEAHDHSFYYPGAQNWGWSQFARRDVVYYQANTVRQQDAFLVICSITATATPPAPVPSILPYTVPRDILDTVGALLDDPVYSDVVFVLPQHTRTGPHTIYAARKLLQRVEYFDDMFSSGFAEGTSVVARDSDIISRADQNPEDDTSAEDFEAYATQFDDSDFEDEAESAILENDHDSGTPPDPASDNQDRIPTEGQDLTLVDDLNPQKRRAGREDVPPDAKEENATESDDESQSRRNTRPKLSHPSTPRSREMELGQSDVHANSLSTVTTQSAQLVASPEVPGPKKAHIVVRDVAYTTYRAVLYYIYTDMIVFAPLSSTFLSISSASSQPGSSAPSPQAALPSENLPAPGLTGLGGRANQQQPSETAASSISTLTGPRTRKEWVTEWERNNPGRPRPPSAKSVYRLADRLGLQDLKDRASRHIIKSLTVENVAHEAFSAFSAAFEDVRKVQVAFMFDHWMEVRTGALANIGQLLRLGKLPGFEEVWPMILQNLVAEKGDADSVRQS